MIPGVGEPRPPARGSRARPNRGSRVIEVQFFIPVATNAGVVFPARHDAMWEAELNRLFGGHSRLPGVVAGQWVQGGQVYVDQSRIYLVALTSITQGDLVDQAAAFARAHYGQLAIYVRYLGLSEVL
jgi:hypothetical protein